MRSPLLLVLVAALGGCSSTPQGPIHADNPALLDLWSGMEAAYGNAGSAGIPCPEWMQSWFDFGLRGQACVVNDIVPLPALVVRYGAQPFESGPHTVTNKGVRLNLTSERGFGHYDPDFVDWVIDEGIVGENRPTVRALTQPIYDRHLQRIARIYWVTQSDMRADGFPRTTPAGVLADYAAYLNGGSIPDGAEGYEGGFSVFYFTDLSEGVVDRAMPGLSDDWSAKYEANTAFGFWIRRRSDGTLAQWQDGLRRLLRTYDADWLSAQSG